MNICVQHYGFMEKNSIKDAIFALKVLIKKYRGGQMVLNCVF